MPRARYRLLFPILPLLVVFPLFFVSWGQKPTNPLRQLDNLAHLGYFALFAWAITLLPQVARRTLSVQLGLSLASVLAVGGTIELIQPRFGRTASWYDLGIDLVGGLLGLLFFAACRHRLHRGLLAGGRLAGLALAGLALAGPAVTLWDMGQAARSFPVLGDFESHFETERWTRGTIDHSMARHGHSSLKVVLTTARYSGTTLFRCLGNWQGYSALALSIDNPGPGPLQLTLSVRDWENLHHGGSHDDRFNRAFLLKTGWNDLRIPMREIKNAPAHRSLDLANLREVVIFATRLSARRVIHLDDLRLIP